MPTVPSPAAPKPLRGKRARFVEEYLVDLNGTQAAVRAGYGEKNARFTAAELLAHPDVQAAVTAGRAAQSRRTEVDADRVIKELAKVAFSDIRDVLTWTTVRVGLPSGRGLPGRRVPIGAADRPSGMAASQANQSESGCRPASDSPDQAEPGGDRRPADSQRTSGLNPGGKSSFTSLALIPADALGPAGAAIAELAETAGGGLKVKLHSKLRALELLGRHFGVFEKAEAQPGDNKTKLTPENVGDIVERARLRLVANAGK